MKVAELLPPERVREIVKQVWYVPTTYGQVEEVLAIAAPEIARAVLLEAAKYMVSATDIETLHELAQEIEP